MRPDFYICQMGIIILRSHVVVKVYAIILVDKPNRGGTQHVVRPMPSLFLNTFGLVVRVKNQ